MAIPHHVKRQSMNAVCHPETQAHMRMFRGSAKTAPAIAAANQAAPEPRGLTVKSVKMMAMNAISNVETVAQVGTMRLAGGVALYAARIREADRDGQRDAALRDFNKAHYGRSHDLRRD